MLAKALRAALDQEDVDAEVVVIDEGSTDETPERLQAVDDPRLRVFRHERARGVAQARNRGIAEARGQWVAFLDDDDVWSPRKLRSLIDAASATGASFAYSSVVHVDKDLRAVWIERAPDPAELPESILRRCVIPAGCSNVVCRTSLARDVGGFDERLFHLADWDLWIRLSEGASAAASDELLVGYLRHPGNMLMRDPYDVLVEFDYLVEKHRALRRARGVEVDREEFLRWIARVYHSSGQRMAAVRTLLRGALANRSLENVPFALVVAVRPRAPMRRRRLARLDRAAPSWLELYR